MVAASAGKLMEYAIRVTGGGYVARQIRRPASSKIAWRPERYWVGAYRSAATAAATCRNAKAGWPTRVPIIERTSFSAGSSKLWVAHSRAVFARGWERTLSITPDFACPWSRGQRVLARKITNYVLPN